METVATSNPNVLGGVPVFTGTRVPIECFFDYLRRGRSVDYFLQQFPTVKRAQVDDLLAQASELAAARAGLA
jgi:uncharacterized protein (DUF433 family)